MAVVNFESDLDKNIDSIKEYFNQCCGLALETKDTFITKLTAIETITELHERYESLKSDYRLLDSEYEELSSELYEYEQDDSRENMEIQADLLRVLIDDLDRSIVLNDPIKLDVFVEKAKRVISDLVSCT